MFHLENGKYLCYKFSFHFYSSEKGAVKNNCHYETINDSRWNHLIPINELQLEEYLLYLCAWMIIIMNCLIIYHLFRFVCVSFLSITITRIMFYWLYILITFRIYYLRFILITTVNFYISCNINFNYLFLIFCYLCYSLYIIMIMMNSRHL